MRFKYFKSIPKSAIAQAALIFFAAFVLFHFQNCSKTSFTQAQKGSDDGTNGGLGNGGDSGNGGDPGTGDPGAGGPGTGDPGSGGDPGMDPPIVTPKDPVEIISNCEAAAASGQIYVSTSTLTFDDTRAEAGNPRVICDYGNNGNHLREDYPGQGNNFMVARYEQVRTLNLPVNAELCDFDLKVVTTEGSGDSQKLYYDDMFYLTMNDVVLASSHKDSLPNLISTAATIGQNYTGVQIYLYNWSRLVGKHFDNDNDKDYALGYDQGLTQFNWPKTQKTGSFTLDFNKEILIHAGARSANSSHQFRFAITGDNDAEIDCYHSEFQFEIKAKYYLKQ